ncbi:hypothetical protein TrLO_g6017 [Triparma laevis f. longispina]|uniref:Lactoylglutathione lyase n=1 Tax=Triparma laevis f. longispina TaxID=1714387 RepID=A0A9W7FSX8_9STRA|nr:hypothetical protein TrLO_g6017 [Triparma laevis f. longispina]
MSSSSIIPGNPTWHQTMLRITDPTKTLDFYQNKMGLTLLNKLSFPSYNFDLYFLASHPEPYALEVGSDEANKYLWSYSHPTLELTHNYNSPPIHPSNIDNDGFGHIAFHVNDVYSTTSSLLSKSVDFKKKPDEGNMKGLAFAYDPDKYWVEIVKRSSTHSLTTEKNLSQTMLRVKDPKKSVAFYESLGMTVLIEKHFPQWKFSLFFMGCLQPSENFPKDGTDEEKSNFVNSRHDPVIELTHNHGTESDPDFKYTNGNEEGKQGFGHVGFLVDNVETACESLKSKGYTMKKEPMAGTMKGLAFVYDPDGYSVEVIKRGGYDDKGTPYYFE